MNSGLSVILGALIALTGSALIPWLRESLTQRRVRAESAKRRRDDALVDLLEKNTNLGFTSLSGLGAAATVLALQERSRASARLLLETDDLESRAAFSTMLARSIPIANSKLPDLDKATDVGDRILLMNDLLVRWSAGELTTAELLPKWNDEIRKQAAKRKRSGEAPAR